MQKKKSTEIMCYKKTCKYLLLLIFHPAQNLNLNMNICLIKATYSGIVFFMYQDRLHVGYLFH